MSMHIFFDLPGPHVEIYPTYTLIEVHKSMWKDVCCSIIYDSPKIEILQISFSTGLFKWILVLSHSEILYHYQKNEVLI